MHLEGRTVVVSGVGIGLGKEIAGAVLDGGGNAVIAARTPETLERVATELDPSQVRIAWQRTDITSPGDCASLIEFARFRHRRTG